MTNVVTLKKPDPQVWTCTNPECGCQTFFLYKDQTIECANCQAVGADIGGWGERLPDVEIPTDVERQSIIRITDSSPEFVLRKALREMGSVKAVIVMTENTLNTWGARQDAEWFDARLRDVRNRFIMESDDVER